MIQLMFFKFSKTGFFNTGFLASASPEMFKSYLEAHEIGHFTQQRYLISLATFVQRLTQVVLKDLTRIK